MKRFLRLQKIYEWRYYLSLGFIVGLVGVTRFFNLTNIPPGLADHEVLNLKTAETFNALTAPLEAVYFSVLRVIHEIGILSPLALRIVSAVIGITVIGLIYILLRKLFNARTAIYGTVLTSVSSWLLFASRIGSPEILLLLWTLLFVLLLQNTLRKDKLYLYMLSGIVLGLGLYTPFFIYFALPVLALFLFVDKQESGRFNWNWLIIPGVGIILLGPLIYATVMSNLSISEYFQLGAFSLIEIDPLRLFQILYGGTEDVGVFHGKFAPYIDIATGLFALYGMLWFGKNRRDRHFWLGIMLLVLSLLVWVLFSGAPAVLFVYSTWTIFFAAIGVEHFLERWYNVFPRNPVARRTALFPILLIFLFIAVFHLQNYFVAFPKTPESTDVYHEVAPEIIEYIETNNLEGSVTVIAEPSTNQRVQSLAHYPIQAISPPVDIESITSKVIILEAEVSGFQAGDNYKETELITSDARNYELFHIFEK